MMIGSFITLPSAVWYFSSFVGRFFALWAKKRPTEGMKCVDCVNPISALSPARHLSPWHRIIVSGAKQLTGNRLNRQRSRVERDAGGTQARGQFNRRRNGELQPAHLLQIGKDLRWCAVEYDLAAFQHHHSLRMRGFFQ